MIPTRAEIRQAYDAGYDAVVSLIEEGLGKLLEQVKAQETQVKAQEARLAELERRLNQNSQNSNKPPSSDGHKKPSRSLRKKSGRRSGGQEGHAGTTLEMVTDPDRVIEYWPEHCNDCGARLGKAGTSGYEARQVHDIPPIKIEVTEHRAMQVGCGKCQHTTQAIFPAHIKPGVKYGNGIAALGAYATMYQLLPLERTCEFMRDLFGCEISEGTLVNQMAACVERARPIEAEIKAAVIRAEVAHFDETGARVAGALHWLHVASTPELTYYAFDDGRAGKAFDRIEILPAFKGTGVHDALPSYLKRDFTHALCNAHLLRELTGIEESTAQRWPGRLKALLVEMKERVERSKLQGQTQLRADVQRRLEAEYDRLVNRARRANPREEYLEGQRGRPRASPARNLADRLRKHKDSVLRFLRDFRVPFDNNQAERDLRMMKVKQKVSGCFRSLEGARTFATLRGYISTLRKQGHSAYAGLRALLDGRPLSLNLA